MENNPAPINTSEGNMAPSPQKSGKGAVVALVVVLVLAIGAVGGTWYYMNNKAKNDNKAQQEQIQQLQKQVSDITTKADKELIVSQAKAAFNYWIGGSSSSNPKTYQTMKDSGYITQNLVDFQKNPPKQYDVLTCSQNALPFNEYVFKDPNLQNSTTATMNVEGKYTNSVNVITLGFVKDGSTWKINTVSCPNLEAQAPKS